MLRLSSARVAAVAAFSLLLGAAAVGCVDAPTEHRLRANAFLRGGDPGAALKEIDLGLARKQDDVALLIMRGKALFELDRMDEAKGAYNQAISAGKSLEERALAEARLGLAMIASRAKDWPAARAEFESLVRINEKDATSHLNVARVCLEMKDTACAIEHGERAGQLRGNEESVLYTLGMIYLAADKTKEAELTFQHICDIVPGASSCPYGVALAAAKAGDKARAVEQLREAVRRKVPNPQQVATDPGFASIKDEPGFVEIVSSLGGAAPR